MRRIVALVAFIFLSSCPALAQTARVVTSCNTAGYAAGATQPLVQDINGNACVAVVGLEQGDVSGTFTNATQATSITSTSQDGFGTALITIAGTYGTATAVFELSDDSGTTWFPMAAARTDGSGSDLGYTSLTNVSRAWIIPVAGMDLIRVRSTAVASGTVNVRISSTSVQTSPIPVTNNPLTASATGSTGAISATLTAVANKTTYICGFNFQGSDATAAVAGNIAVSGVITGTMNFGYVSLAGAATVVQPPPVIQNFTPCVPASGTGVNIVVTPPTLGAGATLATVSVWGYNQ